MARSLRVPEIQEIFILTIANNDFDNNVTIVRQIRKYFPGHLVTLAHFFFQKIQKSGIF
jgi:hypothetical protein